MEEGRSQLLYGSLVGLALGVPLLGMMNFIFIASATLLLIASPLLLLVSPVLIIAGLILAATMTGYAVADTMAVVGVWALKWDVCGVQDEGLIRINREEWVEKLKEWGEKLKAVTGYSSNLNGELQVKYM